MKCRLNKANSLTGIWARDCCFQNSLIVAGNILRFEVQDSKFATRAHGVEDVIAVQTSTSRNSSSDLVSFNNCTIEDCYLRFARFHQCKLSGCSTNSCNMLSSSLALRRFAPELRAMIFKYVDHKYLLKAFRRDRLIYSEIMASVIFSTMSKPFELDKKTKKKLAIMPIHGIEKLSLLGWCL